MVTKHRHTFLVALLGLTRGLNILIEPHPMTEEELEDRYYTLGTEVKKYGVRVL
ncbi:MAG: hypothetical protein ACD_22C00043G0004 [uncultured bacterium]|nr:MAG: hypothetical protein ACD_22C00043G0004 [uncultured bacterium]